MKNQTLNYDLLILYSGGADSRLMLEFAKYSNRNPYCLLINYNQLHSEELDFARQQLSKLNIPHQEVSISGLQINSGLTGNGEKGRFGDENEVSPWFVPGRNTMFASIALSVVENLGIEEVWLGADYSDLVNGFLDCTQEFINEVDRLYSVAASFPIRFRAPLLGIDKDTIKTLLKSFGVRENEVFSGYGRLEENKEEDIPDRHKISFRFNYHTYLSFPTIYFDRKEPNLTTFVTTGTYRFEGHDPKVHDYGLIYKIPYDGEMRISEIINNCEYKVEIVDLDQVRGM